MTGKEFALITIETEPVLNIQELCEACRISPDLILELVEYGVLEPKGMSPQSWLFDVQDLRRVRRLMRLQQDLEVNLAGAALALDLIKQMDEMRARLEAFERYFVKRY